MRRRFGDLTRPELYAMFGDVGSIVGEVVADVRGLGVVTKTWLGNTFLIAPTPQRGTQFHAAPAARYWYGTTLERLGLHSER